MEKSFTNRASFAVIKTEIESLISSGVKYCDNLESGLVSKQESQSIANRTVYESTINTLPQVSQSAETVYKNKRERKAILDIEEKLPELVCYEPICVDEYFPLNRAQKYTFVKRPHYQMYFIFRIMQKIFRQYVLYVARRYDLRKQSRGRSWGNKTIFTQVFLQNTHKKWKS